MNLPKIAIVGYGKMGKEIEHLALNENFIITDIFDINKQLDINKQYDFDVAIEFTSPETVIENIEKLANLKKNIVVGTTGWYDKLELVERITNQNQIGLVWGSNFSIGMNLFFKLIEYSSKLFNKFEQYDPFLYEIHHNKKKDSPSGTAVTLSEILLNHIDRKDTVNTTNIDIKPNELSVTSSRGGSVPGTHTITFDSLADSIELTHTARNRSGFAFGSLEAAKMIYNRKGFYNFQNIIESKIKNL